MLLVRSYLPVFAESFFSGAESKTISYKFYMLVTYMFLFMFWAVSVHSIFARQHIAQLPRCKPTVGKLPPRVHSPDLGDNGLILILMVKHSCSNYL